MRPGYLMPRSDYTISIIIFILFFSKTPDSCCKKIKKNLKMLWYSDCIKKVILFLLLGFYGYCCLFFIEWLKKKLQYITLLTVLHHSCSLICIEMPIHGPNLWWSTFSSMLIKCRQFLWRCPVPHKVPFCVQQTNCPAIKPLWTCGLCSF